MGHQPCTANVTPEAPGDWQVFNQMQRNYNLMVNTYGVDKQVWITEYGDPTAPVGVGAAVSETAQRTNLELAYYRAARTPWHGPILYYSERDMPNDRADAPNEPFFGLSNRDGSWKLAAHRFLQLATQDDARQIQRPASGNRLMAPGRYFYAGPVNFKLTGATYTMTARSGVSINASNGMLSITSGASTGTLTVTTTLGGLSVSQVITII
ncbi:MAG: hypothetical protein FJX25_11705 [Alphaproteobacteria bacterium]|nr:hypothetical protein [Alphaproteobacteria bacterium]